MKTLNALIVGGLLIATAGVAQAGKIEKTYVYEGDEGARSVCMAIAKNQVGRLDRVLNANKYSRFDRKVHERFLCNGQDLLSFAEEVNSTDIARFLAPKFGAPRTDIAGR